jgi:membrane protease YdiL (CAAX protease family)
MIELTLWDHLLAILIGVVLPAQALFTPRASEEFEEPEPMGSRAKIATYWVNSAVLWIVAGLVLWAWHGRDPDWSTLGLVAGREPAASAWILVSVFVAFLADVGWKLRSAEARRETRRRWMRDAAFMPSRPIEFAHSLVLAASAGVCEEIAFRGHLVAYLTSLLGQDLVLLAVLLPAVGFGLSHIYQGWASALKIIVMAGAFGWFYVRTGSLLPLIATHFAIDVVGMLLSSYLMRAEAADARAA